VDHACHPVAKGDDRASEVVAEDGAGRWAVAERLCVGEIDGDRGGLYEDYVRG
jgi:hypothetical protein